MMKPGASNTFAGMSQAALSCEDAMLFLAVADSFSLKQAKRWERRLSKDSWSRIIRQTEQLFKRLDITGMDNIALYTLPTQQEHLRFASCHLAPDKVWSCLPLEQAYRQKRRGDISNFDLFAFNKCHVLINGSHNNAPANGGAATLSLNTGSCWFFQNKPIKYAEKNADDHGTQFTQTNTQPVLAITGKNLASKGVAPRSVVSGNLATEGAEVGNVAPGNIAAGNIAAGSATSGNIAQMLPDSRFSARHLAALTGVWQHLTDSYEERSDHLSVILSFMAFLVHNRLFAEAHCLLANHLEWLPDYKRDLLNIAPYASFYALLLDMITRIKTAPLLQYHCSSQHGSAD
jgi:hypothetical protein